MHRSDDYARVSRNRLSLLLTPLTCHDNPSSCIVVYIQNPKRLEMCTILPRLEASVLFIIRKRFGFQYATIGNALTSVRLSYDAV
jgi:hypothetical protein